MKKVLMIAYYFPPLGGAGVQRTLKFVKYLPEFGWQPVVLTVNVQGSSLVDPSMKADIPANLPIYRTPAFLLPQRLPWRLRNLITRWILLVDEHLGWYPFAARKLEQIFEEHSIQALYSTSAPQTGHVVADKAMRKTGFPWIADFRDPWITHPTATFPTPLHHHILASIEQRIVSSASKITVVSEPMRASLVDAYPHLPPQHFYLIPNGYDPQDFSDGMADHSSTQTRDPSRFTIVYTGSFYGYRQAHNFLKAISQAVQESGVPRREIQVILVGSVGKVTFRAIEQLGLNDIVKATGYLPHKEAIHYLLSADILLLVVGRGPGSDAVMTGKIYEYLASGKPILALAPDSAAAALVHEAQAGIVVDPDDIQVIANEISSLYQLWKNGGLRIHPLPEVVARYNRKALTARLAGILDDLSQGG